MYLRLVTLWIISSLVLSGCGTSSENISLWEFSGKGFIIQVPKAWTKVEDKSLPKPKNGNVAGAWTSSDITSGFANNLLILKDTLLPEADPKMTSRKYAVINQALTTGEYKEYTKLSDKTITFGDKDEGLAVVFEAKYNNDTPKQKFIQAAKLCGRDIYLMTIGLALSNNSTDKYTELLSSFTCTK